QAFGGGGVTHPFLSHAWAAARTLRLADGPDEVHRRTIAKLELGKHH
ncbi:MAG: acyl-CoA dehydrogenase family protein, partial [Pseudomonadota bacterium]